MSYKCDCGYGVLWPIATDGDDSYPWVERCDTCCLFEDDVSAAEFLAEKQGKVPVVLRWHPTLNRYAPTVHGPEMLADES